MCKALEGYIANLVLIEPIFLLSRVGRWGRMGGVGGIGKKSNLKAFGLNFRCGKMFTHLPIYVYFMKI